MSNTIPSTCSFRRPKMVYQDSPKSRLDEAVEFLSKVENTYRRLGIAYHKLSFTFCQTYLAKEKRQYLAELNLEETARYPPRVLPRLKAARGLLRTAKALFDRGALEEFEPVYQEMCDHLLLIDKRLEEVDHDLERLIKAYKEEQQEKIARRLQDEVVEEDLALTEKEGEEEKHRALVKWILQLPEVQQNFEKKWGQSMDSMPRNEAFEMAIEVVPELTDAKTALVEALEEEIEDEDEEIDEDIDDEETEDEGFEDEDEEDEEMEDRPRIVLVLRR